MNMLMVKSVTHIVRMSTIDARWVRPTIECALDPFLVMG